MLRQPGVDTGTLRDVDVLLVMRDGDTMEQGAHDELIAARGASYELYQSRFSGPASAEAPVVEGGPLLAEVEGDSRGRPRP